VERFILSDFPSFDQLEDLELSGPERLLHQARFCPRSLELKQRELEEDADQADPFDFELEYGVSLEEMTDRIQHNEDR